MRPALLHGLLEGARTRCPDRVAVVDGDRSLTYEALDRQANQLAHLLRELGLSAGDRVGLYLDKSLESVLGIYGILKAGGTYVPLDPYAPSARVGYIAADCGLRFLLTGAEKEATVADVARIAGSLEAAVVLKGDAAADGSGVRMVPPGALDAQPEAPPVTRTVSLDLAYILYTSGSTGQPKGVMLSHLNGMAFVEWAGEYIAVRSDDRLSSHAPLHFDLSIFDLFVAAQAGATVVLVPPRSAAFPRELAAFIAESRITVWYSVPSALTALTLRGGLTPGVFPDLRAVLFAGEAFPPKHLSRLMDLVPAARFVNLYGPTETNVCTHYEVQRPLDPGEAAIPIGVPIGGVDVFALRDDGPLSEAGDIGELCVRGPTVMQGYWGDPERSARALGAPLPGDGLGAPAYRTGDLVRRDADGNYWFLGRRDAQVKSRGYRIELGEIETALLSHPAVTECAALAVPDETITNRIVAFVEVSCEAEEAELARHCAKSLPRYMIPEMIGVMSGLPKTSTGKVDRRALVELVGS